MDGRWKYYHAELAGYDFYHQHESGCRGIGNRIRQEKDGHIRENFELFWYGGLSGYACFMPFFQRNNAAAVQKEKNNGLPMMQSDKKCGMLSDVAETINRMENLKGL